AWKILYNTAFQEPAPILLFGGWSGRQANPQLKPEKVRNLELIWMDHQSHSTHEFSLYQSNFQNVIKEEAENAGEREIWGLEYRGRHDIENFIGADQHDISLFFNYTFTHTKSSIIYDFNTKQWVDGSGEIGDIAKHKFNLGINIPTSKRWNLNFRGNYVGKRKLYLRNPLRRDGKSLGSHFLVNTAVTYEVKKGVDIVFKVVNIFDKNYFLPGGESASSGDNFNEPSQGWHNSVIPTPGRSFYVSLNMSF
ncbi:TonB-dependent receptor, partial [bacterium]|nr:TonB-dependent receptor [bacterium]